MARVGVAIHRFREDAVSVGRSIQEWCARNGHVVVVPPADAALFAAERTVDPAARQALFQKAETILLEAAPIIPLYHYTHVFLKQPTVKGWHPTLLDLHPYKHVWLEN